MKFSLRSAVSKLANPDSYPKNITDYVKIIPGVIYVSTLLAGSIAIIVFYSFLEEAPPQGEITLTLQKYIDFVSEPLYVSVMTDSFIIAAKSTLITLVLAYPAAYFLAYSESDRKNFYVILMILPFWMNIVARTFAWRLILGSKGVINFIFYDTLGIFNHRLNLLLSQEAILIGLIHVFLPFMIVPLYTSLEKIDRSHIEAAKSLGASKLEAFYEITLPQSLPGVAAGVLLVFILSFGSLITPLLLGGQRNLMISNILTSMFRVLNNWSLGSAIAVVFALIVIITLLLFSRLVSLQTLYSNSGEERN
jgi:ABC-type spermidine/putrescine transport system permease subunit I